MDYKQAVSRNQVSFSSLEEQVQADNPVRFLEAFVEQLELIRLGYVLSPLKTEGRPPFHPKVFLKLYLYGYLNGIRSSRRLEKESGRNIELQWLLQKQTPNYHSISDFRKDNPVALKNTFKLFVLFLKEAGLVAGQTVAIDGTKIRAHNSKKNNYTSKKLQRHLQYIEDKTNEYFTLLDSHDADEGLVNINEVTKKISTLKKHKIRYEALSQQLSQSGEPQLSTTDEDARSLLVQGQVVEVCYNTQTAVDAKHKLVVATHTISRNDRNALHNIAKEAKANLGVNTLTAISDKGYHNGRQLQQCADDSITTICAQQEIVNSNEYGTTPAYIVTRFTYNKEEDTYTCPQGHTLRTKGTWHNKVRERDSYEFKKYRTPACNSCLVKHLCTGRQKGGREIERSQYAQAVEQNKERYHRNKELYRTRQEINEHIFGTIKRKWGYNHTNLKGLKKVNGEMALIMTVYNIKRSFNILGIETLIEKIRNWVPNYKGIAHPYIKLALWEGNSATQNFQLIIAA